MDTGFGRWPGLAMQDLEKGEDPRITTDLRTVLAELLNKRLGGTVISSVFPGFSRPTSAIVFLQRPLSVLKAQPGGSF